MEILSKRVDTWTKAQGKKKSPHLLKPKESSSIEIFPKRVDTWATLLKWSEMIESIVTKNQFHTEKFVVEGLKLKDTPWYKKDNLIHWKTLLYILSNSQLQEQIIQQNHNHPLADLQESDIPLILSKLTIIGQRLSEISLDISKGMTNTKESKWIHWARKHP